MYRVFYCWNGVIFSFVGQWDNFVTEKSQNKLTEDRLSWLNKLQFSCSTKCKKLFHYKLNSWNGCLLLSMVSLRSWLKSLAKMNYQRMSINVWMSQVKRRVRVKGVPRVYQQGQINLRLIHIPWDQEGPQLGQSLAIPMMDIQGASMAPFLIYHKFAVCVACIC